MAGQLTLTREARARREKACRSRTQISLPVPLSPWIRTGTSVSATRSSLFRTACIAADFPKMISSGGRVREAADSALWTKVIFSYRRLDRNPRSLQYPSQCTWSTNHKMQKQKTEDILRSEERIYTPIDFEATEKLPYWLKLHGRGLSTTKVTCRKNIPFFSF